MTQEQFYLEHGAVVKAKDNPSKGGRGALPNYKLDYRIGLGLEFLGWASSEEGMASASSRFATFSKHKWQLQVVEKKTRQFVKRCSVLASDVRDNEKVWKASKGNNCAKSIGVPRASRLRSLGLQGRPVKASSLREGLWDWFVSVRSSVAVRIPPKLVILQGKALASAMIKEMERTGAWIDMPKVDRAWLARWKKQYGVSLRKPNAKYKCSKAVLLSRLRAMWVTTVRLRAFAKFSWGRDLVCEGYDQKGLHMNEGGSKNTGTLDIKGAPEVRLKENHAATRQRLSLMTGVTSSEEEATLIGGPPLEVLFKGMTDAVLKQVELDPNVDVSVAAKKLHGRTRTYVHQGCASAVLYAFVLEVHGHPNKCVACDC